MQRVILLVIALGVAACGSGPSRGPATSEEVTVTFDGLTPVENSVFAAAWADADIDFSQYRKMILAPAEFEFRAVSKTGRSQANPLPGETAFWISAQSKQQLIDTVTEVFGEELASSEHWEIADTPGPDTLVIVGKLLDIVSRVPPEKVGVDDVYLDSVGEATLVFEIKDSLSGETIFRAVDRGRVDASGRELARSTTVTTWTEVRRWARRWAVRIVEGMDSIHES